jgi:DNA modification methylase
MNKLFGDNMPHIQNDFSKDGRIVLYAGDCLGAVSAMPAKSIQLIITSPPYNVGKSYERSTALEEYLKTIEPVLTESAGDLSQ